MTRKPLQHSQSLAMAIEEQRAKTDTRQILTRSQAKLADELKNLANLEGEKAVISSDLAQTRTNLLSLTKLYDRLEGEERDIDVLIRASRDAVHALRSEGIEMPADPVPAALTPAQDRELSDTLAAAIAPQGGLGK